MNTAMNHRRATVTLVSGVLALAACGSTAEDTTSTGRDPVSAGQPAQAAEAEAGVPADHPADRPAARDQLERAAQAKTLTPWLADPARHPANQDPQSSNASPWLAHPARHPTNQDPESSNASLWLADPARHPRTRTRSRRTLRCGWRRSADGSGQS